MKEAFFVLAIMAILAALTAFRYRRQINTVIGVWRMLKSARQGPSPKKVETSESVAGPLVSCAKCGTWVPESRAVRVPPKFFYCTKACLERAVETV